MNRTNNINFAPDQLVGNLRNRSFPKTGLDALGVSKNDIDDICAHKSAQDRAHRIVQLAKKTLLQEMQNSCQNSPAPLPLAERISQITAHVYRWTYLSDNARQELTDALNTQMHQQSADLSDTLARLPTFEWHKQSIDRLIKQTASTIERYEQEIEKHETTSPILKRKEMQRLQEKVTQERCFLQSAVHTQNIFHQTLGKTHPHRIRTRPNSEFHILLEPKPGSVGKEYKGLGIAFSPIKSDPSQKPKFVTCSPLRIKTRTVKSHTQIPVEIELGNGKTKWVLISVNKTYIPEIVTNWLTTEEGQESLEKAKNANWSLENELDELHYRYVPTSDTIEKRHMFFGRHAYVSPDAVLLGREDYSQQKFDGILGKGGINTAYRATTYAFTETKPSETQRVIRKTQDKERETPERAEHKQKIYSKLKGCKNVAVPKFLLYKTLKKGTPKMLETMQLCNQGSLDQVTLSSDKEKLSICTQIANGVAEMHERGVWHGDLKPQNIFLDQQPGKDLQAFISDIDDAAYFGETTGIYTSEFLPPEGVSNPPSKHSAIARDSFALGLSLMRATNYSRKEIREGEQRAANNPNASLQDKLKGVIFRLLDKDPLKRMTAKEAHLCLQKLTA